MRMAGLWRLELVLCMFITNEIDPGEMLAELLKGRRVDPASTKVFRNYGHDADLCPRFERQVSTMLDVYRAYGQEVSDIQSVRDDGIDILLRYENRAGEARTAAIQIKSDHEFDEWKRKKLPLAQTLKSQYATAIENARVDDFYVLLCVDAVEHRSRIRTLCSETKNFKKCHMVKPQDLLDLFNMSDIDLWGRTTRLLCHNDTVLKKASDELSAEDADVAFFLIRLVCRFFEGKSASLTDDALFDWWNDWSIFCEKEADDSERLSEVVSHFSDVGIFDYDGGRRVCVEALPSGLCALYFDLRVRLADVHADIESQIQSLVDLKDWATTTDNS